MGFVRDVVGNINMARLGCSVDVRNPFKKALIEEELTKRGLIFRKGYFSCDSAMVYGIVGGKRDDVKDFLKWYMATEENPKYYINKHKIFRTKMLNVIVE